MSGALNFVFPAQGTSTPPTKDCLLDGHSACVVSPGQVPSAERFAEIGPRGPGRRRHGRWAHSGLSQCPTCPTCFVLFSTLLSKFKYEKQLEIPGPPGPPGTPKADTMKNATDPVLRLPTARNAQCIQSDGRPGCLRCVYVSILRGILLTRRRKEGEGPGPQREHPKRHGRASWEATSQPAESPKHQHLQR